MALFKFSKYSKEGSKAKIDTYLPSLDSKYSPMARTIYKCRLINFFMHELVVAETNSYNMFTEYVAPKYVITQVTEILLDKKYERLQHLRRVRVFN